MATSKANANKQTAVAKASGAKPAAKASGAKPAAKVSTALVTVGSKPDTEAMQAFETALTEAKATGQYGACRVIVRGRMVAGTGNPIYRAVSSIDAPGNDVAEVMANAYAYGEAGKFDTMARDRGFVETTTRTVYPPVGLLCRGGISRGFGVLPDGSLAFVKHGAKGGEPAPAAIVAKHMGEQSKPAKQAN